MGGYGWVFFHIVPGCQTIAFLGCTFPFVFVFVFCIQDSPRLHAETKVGEIYKIDMADLQSHLQIFPLRIPT